MSQQRLNEFSEFELNEEELKVAAHFTEWNIMFIQNQRAQIASSKLNLALNPDRPDEFKMNIAHLQGQLDFIAWLLAVATGQEKKQEAAVVEEDSQAPKS